MESSKYPIDYTAKIMNFLAMTETGDQEVVTQYLQECNQDETQAVNKFFSKIPSSNNNYLNSELNREPLINQRKSKNNSQNSRLNENRPQRQNQGFISKYIVGFFKFLFGSCVEPRNVDDNDEDNELISIFKILPNIIANYRLFLN